MAFVERIFSVKNVCCHKVVTILGFKLKFKVKRKNVDDINNALFGLKNEINILKDKLVVMEKRAEITDNALLITQKKYKYIHLLKSCGIHVAYIIQFINKYLNKNEEHCFVFTIFSRQMRTDLSNQNHVYYSKVKNLKHLKNVKFIIHGLFDKALERDLYNNKEILKNTYWYIWGGDLYSYEQNEISDYVRQNIAGIITPFDKQTYVDKFGEKTCFDIPYDNVLLEFSKPRKENKDCIHILVNNCADVATLDMLKTLEKFKDENIKVSTILSYLSWGQKDCKNQIIELGKNIFGDKFNPIMELLPLDKYAEFLNDVDIYISNQNRQQGQGNASFLLAQGKKVFINGETSVYKRYAELGIYYSDTNLIKDINFQEFLYINKDIQEKTVQNLKRRQSIDFILKQWQEFLLYGDNYE